MGFIKSFVSEKEQAIAEEFSAQGYVIKPVEDLDALNTLRDHVVQIVCDQIKTPLPNDVNALLNAADRAIPVEKLNEVRLNTYRKMNAAPWFRPTYFALARSTIEALVGNELAMQNRVNLSIQFAKDNSSSVDIHADPFSGGDTPFQVVVWLPLVDCYKTKSMFILPRAKCEAVYAHFADYRDSKTLFRAVEKDLVWCNVPYGQVLVFSSNYLHGAIANNENETRWSMNCRFTNLFAPYTSAEKKLGSFYLPITMRPVTRMAINFKFPSGFQE